MGFLVENEVSPRSHQPGSRNNIQLERKTVSIRQVVYFNNAPVNSTATHEHLGMILDSKLSYENHLQAVFTRVNKTIGLLRKLQPTLPIKYLVTVYKSFIRPYLG